MVRTVVGNYRMARSSALKAFGQTDTFLISGWPVDAEEQESSSKFLVEFHQQLVAANPSIEGLLSLV